MSELARTPPVELPRGDFRRPLHVAHGVHALDVGGLERIVVDLARVGRERGHRVSVICLEHPGSLAPSAEGAGAAVLSFGKRPGRAQELTTRAAELFANLRPDVLHTHTPGALWHLGPAARASRLPILHTEHVDNVGKARGWWAKLKTRALWHRAARYAGRFCCVSDDIARSALRWLTVPASKVDVVLNGIDTTRYADRGSREEVRARFGIPTDARVIGTVGRLNEVKRQDLLLRAVARPGLEAARVLLVGDGPERQRLEQLAGDLGIRERVHLVGCQSAPERFLPAMDVFALTSRLEGLPLALLEAWAAGLPVVSSAVGGVPKLVRDGETGSLFPSGDVEALAAALRAVLADHEKAARLARAGQRVVRERYALDRMAAEYEARYRELLVGCRGGQLTPAPGAPGAIA